ncbi:hypothetical protein MMC30_000459 [Trapelia coarctata]|nr:hypothetical protein [Trapelia coarctata]
MRPQLIVAFLLCTSFTSAWPWPPSVRNIEGLIQRRQGNNQNTASASASPTVAGTSSDAPSAAASTGGSSNTASITGSSKPSGTASEAATSGGTNSGPTQTGKQSGSKTIKGAQTTSIDQRLPAGGIEMVTPAAIAPASYYKIGDQITFGWNYTSLIVTPTAVDILVSCAANQATYTLSSNASVKETGSVVWDTKADESGRAPLLTETYTLVIHDAAQAVTAVGKPGYLGTFNSFTFGMYLPQSYTPLSDFVCATCSGALSDMERQTLKFMFGMGMITIMSFTWFAGGFGVFF